MNRTGRPETAAILLAAGASSRTGSPKQLYSVGGTALVQHQIEQLLERGLERVYVILGYHAADVEAAVTPAPQVHLCFNPSYEAGMFSSVLTGLAALDGERTVFIHPVDVPVPGAEVFAALRDADTPIAIPFYKGRKGHPVRLRHDAARALLHSCATRLDRWLREHSRSTALVSVVDARVVMNANTERALRHCFGEDPEKETP
jgi:molybdenum cofactor cytidylyltransferase